MVEKYRPFSKRQGLLPEQIVQLESMNDRLRNRLHSEYMGGPHYICAGQGHLLSELIGGFFGLRLGTDDENLLEHLASDLFSNGVWSEVYDFLEVVRSLNVRLEEDDCNKVLEEEKSAYRFVGGKIVAITSPVNLKAIERALEHRIEAARNHIANALSELAARTDPNYAKVVGEAMQAVEAVARELANDPVATLGQALNKLRGGTWHPALLKAHSAMYGWASDEGGARHAHRGEPIDAATARYMLVNLSAFLSYLTEAASASKIPAA